MTEYQIAVDLELCDGIFACLVRDDRFEEAADGLVELPGGTRDEGVLTATFDDDRLSEAEDAAAACPTNAITVEEVPR